ncbi:SprB repeat-containing protein, partial [Flavobacterium sp.]|uniref:SprB repeat-containing protein n=1 Tax=Flavobacterium sp. TaxID=239 RepID=UPI0038FC1A7D
QDNTASGIVCTGFKYTYEGTEYAPGVYDIPRTDANGCAWKTVLTVTENPLPPITCIDPASTTVLCGVTKEAAQTNTDAEFLSWLNTFTYNTTLYTVGIVYAYDLGSVKSDNGDGPKNPATGANTKVTVTWTLTDKETGCKNSCSSTFTVANACIPTCSYTKTDVKCQGTGTGSITVTVSGGTLPYTVNLFKDGNPVALDSKTGIVEPYIITFENLFSGAYSYSVTDDSQSDPCSNSEPIDLGQGTPCGANCTYTQGYYGNEGGTSCANGVSYSTKGLIAKALSSYPLGTMTIGLLGRSIKISNNPTDIQKIIDFLPGGGSSAVLSVGDFLITALPSSYLKKGVINNTLLAQTITLGLNLGIDNTLGTFALQSGTLAIASPQGGCGSIIPMVRSCSYDIYTPTINEYKYYNIPALVGLLPTPTVQGLFDMANTALGGGTLPAGITFTNLASAVDLINNVFDKCRISMGYNQTPLTCIADRAAFDVSPVPIIDYATVIYQFSYVSNVTIEVRNNLGVLLSTYVDTTPSYLGKVVPLPYLFGANGIYYIKVITNIGSTTKAVTH